MTMFRSLIAAVVILGLSACTTNPYTGEREASNKAKGAAIGAGIGAVIGILTGDDADERRKRALIGLGAGALTGTGVGAYMDAQENKLRAQLEGSGVSVTRLGNDLVLNMPGNITFDVDRSDLRGDFVPVLDSVSLVLKEYESTLIDVTGHTDSTGSVNYNLGLSTRRANSVALYLRASGIHGERVETLGVGPNYPIADNQTAYGRQQNRRVELVLRPLMQG
ncbi:MAG: outer membrane protein OmpA-like peptidoglycan-associated protein [Limisphaerales bacterium]|jgi:outer membrane protein OmpA-like peptidoglycan-associated protein